MSKPIVGWDIGGAHLKAALLSSEGNLLQALQLPCELWRGLNQLEATLAKVLAYFNVGENLTQHAVTMTGELVDLFENRNQGVNQIARLTANLLGNETKFYAANIGFLPLNQALLHRESIASANWHASASLIATHQPDALLVDIGSTTTDIIAITRGRVAAIGISDAARMQEDTLVYTGVVRTPIMALAQKLDFEGKKLNVAAEYFATMADVYRLTGDLKTEMDMAETADGKEKTLLTSARRLARMIGHDAENKPLASWQNLALNCKLMQKMQLKLAILKHLKGDAPIIGVGAGAFLVKELAADLSHPYLNLHEVLKMDFDENLSVCFPAYAVARLTLLNGDFN